MLRGSRFTCFTNHACLFGQYSSRLTSAPFFVGSSKLKQNLLVYKWVHSVIPSKDLFKHDVSLYPILGFTVPIKYPISAWGHRNFHSSSSSNQRPQKSDNKKSDKEEEDDKMSSLIGKVALWMLTTYMVIALISLMFPRTNQPEVVRYVAWNEFLHHMLAKGEVEEIIVRPDVDIVTIILREGAIFKGKKVDNRTFHMVVYDTNRFEDKLRDAELKLGVRLTESVPITYERTSDTAGKVLTSLIIVGLLLSVISRSRHMRPPLSMDSFSHLGRAKFTLVDPLAGHGKGVHFSDVAGLNEAKLEVMEFVDYLKRPEHYRELGAKVPRGALLLGPPGCGKTLLAKAVATEAEVPFLSMNGSEFIEMIGGLGAARVRDLFKEARKRSPCIVYIDEIDAVGIKRTAEPRTEYDGASGEGEQTLNQLLVEMDGMASKEGVVVLASTNRAEVLDKALLRPGRFDRLILIDLPTIEERKQIIEQHLKSIALENEPAFYSKRVAYLTPGFSGADIANVCNEAALHAARYKQTVVKGSDLEYAVERLVGGMEKHNEVMSLQEKRLVAYHEAGHALVGWLLSRTDALLKVSIVPRTNHILGFAQYVPSDRRLFSKEDLFEKMCTLLGGRVAESLIFNQVTSKGKDDLKEVTQMAYSLVRNFGMNESVGLLSFPEEPSSEIGRRPYSKKLAAIIDNEVNNLIASSYKNTRQILGSNRKKLVLLAETLLEQETLYYKDLVNLIGPPSGNKQLVELKSLGESKRNQNTKRKSKHDLSEKTSSENKQLVKLKPLEEHKQNQGTKRNSNSSLSEKKSKEEHGKNKK